MKSLLKLAVGAAIAGALIKRFKKKRPAGFTPTELVADTSSVGEGSGDERVLLPADGRVKAPSQN